MTTENTFQYNDKSIFYRLYGDKAAERLLVCVHGLTGNGMDCAALAEVCADKGYYVASIDMPGRGKSDSFDHEDDYSYKIYIDLLKHFLNILNADRYALDWYGISMGGLLGIRLAGEDNSPIKRLILNDIGPEVPQADLDMISDYLSIEVKAETFDDYLTLMKAGREPSYGTLHDDLWKKMAQHNFWNDGDGYFIPAFDRKLSKLFKSEPLGELDLWPFWDNIKSKILVIRGKKSTLFPLSVYEKMKACFNGEGNLDLITFEKCGHVPPVIERHQIDPVVDWLAK